MSPAAAAWLAKLRADAAPPGTVFVIVSGPAGSVAIPAEDIVGKSDNELMAFMVRRLAEQ